MAQNFSDNTFGQATEMSFPSVAAHECRPGSPGGMSLVVAATVTRDQLDAQQPTYEGRSEERLMRDQDRPILHTELRLDGCIKPDGRLGPLKSLNIRVEDDDGVSQPKPGSPHRTISVTMSDQSRVSDARSRSRSRGRAIRDELRIEDGRDIGTGKQQLIWRNPNVVVEAPFNVHNYQVRMLGDQPQGLAAALTEVRPELLPPLKEPQGLQAVLFFDGTADEHFSDQEIVEGTDGTSSVGYKHDFIPNQEQANTSAQPDTPEALDPLSYGYVESKFKGDESDYHRGGEDGDEAGSIDTSSPLRHDSGKSENLQILQSLPQDLVSSLVKSHSRRFTASEHSEGSERGVRVSNQRYSYTSAADQGHEGSPRRSRDDRSMNVQDSGSSAYTSYFTNSDSRVTGSSRHEGRGSQRSSRKFHDGTEQSEGVFEGRTSPRRSKHHSRHMAGTPGSSYTSDHTASTARGDGSYHEGRSRLKSSRKILEGVNEEHEVHYDGAPPPPPPPEGHRDSRRRTRKVPHPRESGGSVSFRSSEVSGDDRRSYGSTYRTKSHTDSYRERHPSHQTRDLPSSKAKETEDKMVSISRLLDNMSSITQLLSNFPQPVPGGSQAWNQRSSQDIQGAGSMNRPSQQFLSNIGSWQFDPNNRPSQLLIEGASQANQMPLDSSQHAQFLDGGPPQQPSTADNLPSQFDNMQSIRPSQLLTNIRGADFQQFDAMKNRSSQHLNKQSLHRSSQLMDGRASQIIMQDPNFQQFDSMNQRPSQLFGGQLTHPGLQSDGSILLGTMNRSSQLNILDDGSPRQDTMSRQQSQVLTQRLSQPNVQDDNGQQSPTMKTRQSVNSRPSQLGSQDKDLQLFDTMSNRASQLALAQRQSQKLSRLKASQQFDNLNIPSQLNMQNDNFQQPLLVDSRPSRELNGRPSQMDLQGTGVHQFGAMNNRLSQMDMQGDGSRMLGSLSMRPSQLQKNSLSQLNVQGQDSQQFQALDNLPSEFLNSRPSQVAVQDSNLKPFDARPSQLGTRTGGSRTFGSMNNQLRQSQLDMQDLQQFDPMNARQSQLLNTRPSQMYMQVDGLQQADNMNNRPSQVLNTRPSQIGMQDDNFQQDDPMNSRSSQLLNARLSQTNLRDDGLQQFDSMNARQSQLLNTRPSQMNLPDDGLQQFDAMSARQSQLVNTRPSQMNLPDEGLQQFDAINARQSQLLNTRPSQMNLPDDGLQQFDATNARPSQLLDYRASQMSMRPSQLLNARPSQMNMQGDQQFDSLNYRPSQVINTRPSQIGMQDDGFQQFETMNPRRSQLLNISRPSQAYMLYDDLQQNDPMSPRSSLPSLMDMRQSQLLNQGPSQAGMQGDGLQQYDLRNSQHSQLLNKRPLQIGMQADDLQQYDPENPRPSLLGNTMPSQINTRQSQLLNTRPPHIGLQDDGFQQFDPRNSRQTQLLNTRLSQIGMQDEDFQQFDPMNPRPSHLLNTRPSQFGMQEDDLQQFDPLNPRPSQRLGTSSSQMNLQDDNVQEVDPMNPRQSQFMEPRPSQRPSRLANFTPSQSNLRPSMRGSMSLICDNCFESGHEALNCPIQVCFICREPGHYARTCVKRNAVQGIADYEDPAMLQEGDMKQEYDAGANLGYDTAQIGESQHQVLEPLGTADDSQILQTQALDGPPQGYPRMPTMTRQPTSDNTQRYPGAESQQAIYQPIQGSYDTIQQLGFLESRNLRRSLAQTVSTMLQEVQELETRSQQSSLAYLQDSMAAQSGDALGRSKLATNKPKQSPASTTLRGSSQFVTSTPQRSRKNSRTYNSGPQTDRSPKLPKDVSRGTDEEDIRKYRTSEWLSNLPIQYETTDINGSQQSQDELEQYAQASELYNVQVIPEALSNENNQVIPQDDMEQDTDDPNPEVNPSSFDNDAAALQYRTPEQYPI